MKRPHGIALFLLLAQAALWSGTVASTAAAPSRADFEKKYRRMDEAFRRQDAHAFVAWCATDVVAIDGNHIFRNREDFERQMAGLIGSIGKVRIAHSVIRRFDTAGDVVRIDFTMHFTGDVRDSGPAPALHHYDTDMNFHNDWRRISGEWRIIRYVTAGESGTIDGKRVPEESSK